MNPYDFVRIDWQKKPDRLNPIKHNSFSGLSGSIKASITAETPVFFKHGNSPYSVKRDGKFIIPATTLKGMIRSVVETVGQGCFHKFSGIYKKDKIKIDYTNKIINQFKACNNSANLCIGCRLFGMITKGSGVRKGVATFSDAEEIEAAQGKEFFLKSMATPKPHHTAFYLDEKEEGISGRKYYFHSSRQLSGSEGEFNVNNIFPLNTGSRFSFTAHFNNITQEELNVLLYALVLESDMRHKIGYAKPLGFGSIKIDIEEIKFLDRIKRYSGDNGTTILIENNLQNYISDYAAPLLLHESITIRDLKRIWQWPSPEGVYYNYPDQKWFTEYSQDRLPETP